MLNISGGALATLRDAITHVEHVVGHPVDVPYQRDQAGDVQRTDADIGHAQNILGWLPQTPLNEGLRGPVQLAQQRLGVAQAEIAVS